MQIPYALIYDLIFLLVVLLAALHGRKQGLLAGLFGLVGAVFGIFGALCVSQQAAAQFYQKVLGQAISQRVETAVEAAGGDLAAAVEGLTFLPESLRLQLGTLLDDTALSLPAQVVALLEPLLLPLIQVVIFIVVWLVIRLVFHLVSKLLQGVNHVPLVGGINRSLGLVLGLVNGVLDCWLLSLALWFAASLLQGRLAFLSLGILRQSTVYSLLANANPFLTYY